MKTSLTSITFRKKPIDEIVSLVCKAELDAIEWGGDVHVAPTDLDAAAKALKLCRENGLGISAYGSYYRCRPDEDFIPVLETALRLEAPVIRVWAGSVAHSSQCDPGERARITDKLANDVRLAKERGCIVATEYHGNTLTDTQASTMQLLREIPDLYTYWQPRTRPPVPAEDGIASLKELGKRVINLHVFYWDAECNRRPLAEGAENLLTYMRTADRFCNPGYAAIEFVKDEADQQFLEDAQVLHQLIRSI